jgi:hypothetical protein
MRSCRSVTRITSSSRATSEMGNRKQIRLFGLIALLIALVSACQANPPDRRTDVQSLTNQIRGMPGVVAASADVADNLAQGLVYLTVSVDAADDLTSDQLAAITSRYLRELRTGKYAGYRAELDVHHGWNVFAVDSGRLPSPTVIRSCDRLGTGWRCSANSPAPQSGSGPQSLIPAVKCLSRSTGIPTPPP